MNADIILMQEAGRWDEAEFELRSGWRVLACTEEQRDVAVFLRGRAASLVAWWGTCYCGVAVAVLRRQGGNVADVFISAHLPDRGMEAGRGSDAYKDRLG